MKFRHNKIKREHSIISGALEWLEDLSKNREVTDIIPGVINVTHSKERGIAYQYDTSTGCKLLLKNGGSIQEAFVVTPKPEVVQEWVAKMMDEWTLMEAALDDPKVPQAQKNEEQTVKTRGLIKPQKRQKNSDEQQKEAFLSIRDKLLIGIKEDFQLVEINQGMRDSYVDSLASMADLEDPKIEDALEPSIRNALEKMQRNVESIQKPLKKDSKKK